MSRSPGCQEVGSKDCQVEGEEWDRKTSSTSKTEIKIHRIRLDVLSVRCHESWKQRCPKGNWAVGSRVQNSETVCGLVRCCSLYWTV